MDDIIRIIKSLENPGVLIDGVSKTVKSEIKQEGGFLGMLFGTLVLVKYVNWKKSHEKLKSCCKSRKMIL